MKTILSGFVLLASITISNAQTVSIGPTAGFGHSAVSIEDTELDSKFWPSYNLGAKLVYSIDAHWGASAAVKFSGEGGNLTGANGIDEVEFRYRSNYIRVPLEGIYFFGDLGNAVRPKIAIGPSFGFLVGGEAEAIVNDDPNFKVKSDEMFEGFDFGVTGALGANFRVGGDKWLNTDVTYYHGLTDISKTVATGKARNRGIGINIGLLFPLGGSTTAKK
jgi:hypothetical protein